MYHVYAVQTLLIAVGTKTKYWAIYAKYAILRNARPPVCNIFAYSDYATQQYSNKYYGV